MRIRMLVLSFLFLTVFTASAAAGLLQTAVSFTEPDVLTNKATQGGIGFTFTASSDITVYELGVYDDGGNGFINVSGYAVSLYELDAAESEWSYLTSTTVNDTGYSLDSFLYADIDPLGLDAGNTYLILSSAVSGAYEDGYVVDAETLTANGIEFGISAWYNETPGIDAIESSQVWLEDGYASYFGPNLRYAPASVPEPATILLMLPGLLFLVGGKKRFKLFQ